MHIIKPMTMLTLLVLSITSYAAPPVTNFEYDANGNLTKITDGLGHATVQQYDALNRLLQQRQPNPTTTGQLGNITNQYNALDQLTSVTDPRNLTTSYGMNAYGEALTLTSPDTGTTTHTYDNAGNLKTKTDAKGQLTTYSYDALNRLTQAVYAGGLTITYTYDQGINGAGRLTSITDNTGSTAYAYDNRGRIISEARTINTLVYTTTYAYNTAGQLTGVAYPTGLVLSYARDGLGRVSQISSTKSGQTRLLASNIAYQPFGGVKSFTFGNGSTYTRGFDTDNRLTSYSLGTRTINVNYDLANRIIAATDAANNLDNKTYAYDNLDRLTSFIATNSNQSYGYDLTGNRTSLTIGANNYTNTIATSSNRLTASSGPTPKTNTFDNNGSITNTTVNQFSYDTRGRLIQSVGALGTTNYGINALGQRVLKTRTGTNATSVVYHYDLNGQQIAETDTAGAIKQETVYLGDMPLAVIQ
jgi:YD repeat-containing protein